MFNLLFLQNLGGGSIILIAVIFLLLFGGKKIPELMRGLGNGIREFNDAKNKVKDEIQKGMNDEKKEDK